MSHAMKFADTNPEFNRFDGDRSNLLPAEIPFPTDDLSDRASGLLNIIHLAMLEARRLGFDEAAELMKLPALSVCEADISAGIDRAEAG